MGDPLVKSQKNQNEDYKHFILLTKDGKLISRTQCLNPPLKVPRKWNLHEIVRRSELNIHHDLPHCFLRPAAECPRDKKEWCKFLSYIQQRNSVAIAKFEFCEFFILPPEEGSNFSHVRVAYRDGKASDKYIGQKNCESVLDTTEARQFTQRSLDRSETCGNSSTMSPPHIVEDFAARKDANMQARGLGISEDNGMPCAKFLQTTGDHCYHELTKRHQPCNDKKGGTLEKNYARADPSYLQTLGQTHSAWIFGAIAELVDNSRDANASRLDISIEIIYSKRAGKDIPMLSFIDDGCGMTHQEVVRMTCFGHKQPDANNVDRIGRFGVGFKTGAMRLGRDALVLTQTAESRSIAFLSQSLNEGKDNLEIPIVSYRRKGQFMELDTSVQSQDLAKYNLKAVKEFSPFDKYLIGEKAGLFDKRHTGTQIYIWNLDEWGSGYCLDWTTGLTGGSSFHQGDIFIRSKRVRSRPGQMSQKVPLDYSLRCYLEVIFLVPRMKIYVQGSPVKCRPLGKSLNKTCEVTGNIIGKGVNLTLGRCQLEWEQGNCGMFLYWHGRLIEAYKRVGGMIHNGDVGRGMIGVIDVTDLMDNGNGRVWVHSNKQGFQDCEAYAQLEEWLGKKADEYWDKNHDPVQLFQKKGGLLYQPDHEWVQCDKCRKWRTLSPGFDSKRLPKEWFCYMEPFEGSCETPEQKVESGVITLTAKRTGYDRRDVKDDATIASGETEKYDAIRGLKRLKKGLPRACKKTI
ncbi:MORC family CW-type zinc finger protein 3 isoform X2 [Jatropha curcas]|uniref:MORC family CW-type zinc finger protein 3 isoform X2 n=1 Tax=Jatropha curcas TaxID=180498 RepID=UPI0018947C6E|nr:MORC family CW-type zinc finger protein 3 isoform X2 [Jatropha curcas]XP_037493345.1 MORC family CW-type zinc finger protein 3 isoform X2 [Jatropha curcas]